MNDSAFISFVSAAGGLFSLGLVCDGATVQGLVTPVHATPDPLTADPKTGGPPITLPTPESDSNDSTPAVPMEEERADPVVEQHPPKEKAVEGEDVKFSCLLKEADPMGVVVHWIHQGPESEETVLEGNHTTEDRFADRAFLCGDLGHGDFSMMLLNVSVGDRGVYLCVLTVSDNTTVHGSGTKLSIRKDLGECLMRSCSCEGDRSLQEVCIHCPTELSPSENNKH